MKQKTAPDKTSHQSASQPAGRTLGELIAMINSTAAAIIAAGN